jgi:hypothetical protein
LADFELLTTKRVQGELYAAYKTADKKWLKHQTVKFPYPTVNATIAVTETSPGSFTASKQLSMAVGALNNSPPAHFVPICLGFSPCPTR